MLYIVHIILYSAVLFAEKWLFHYNISYFLPSFGMQELMGNNSDTASLVIDVQDYDTLNPYFSQSVYNGNISENQVKAFH